MEDKLIDILQTFSSDENYNELNAVDDIFRLFGVSQQREEFKRPKPFDWLKYDKLKIAKGSSYYEPKITLRQCASWISEYVKKYCG